MGRLIIRTNNDYLSNCIKRYLHYVNEIEKNKIEIIKNVDPKNNRIEKDDAVIYEFTNAVNFFEFLENKKYKSANIFFIHIGEEKELESINFFFNNIMDSNYKRECHILNNLDILKKLKKNNLIHTIIK